MKFFIPNAKDDVEAEQVYMSTRTHVERQHNCRLSPKRIYSIYYRHNGKDMTATVGHDFPNEGPVIAILEASNLYFVCTFFRGVYKDSPILVGSNEVITLTEFDS